MIKVTRTPAIVAIYEDDDNLKAGIIKANQKGYKVLDCFMPFPVHGVEKLLGIKYSRLGYAAFAFACVGFVVAMSLLTYTMTVDWPVTFGGKPTWPLASFIPILFELSVLISSLGMAATYFWVSGLFPGVEPVIYDKRATDDRFVLLLEDAGRGAEIKADMEATGTVEIRNDDFISHNFPGPSPLKLR